MPRSARFYQGSNRKDNSRSSTWSFFSLVNRSDMLLFRGREPPIGHFLRFASRCMPNMRGLAMENLNLEREHHYLIAMASTFTCVKTMELNGCVSRNAGRLGRFITSFPSLSELKMSGLSIRPSRCMFPQYRPASSCLQELNLTLWANVHLLLDYFVQAGPFVTHLTKLVL